VTGPIKFTGCSSAAGATTITYTAAVDTSTGLAATNTQISALAAGSSPILGGPSIARNVVITGINTTTNTITIASGNTSGTALSGKVFVAALKVICPITNLTPNQAQQIISGGGFLSQFTGNPGDTTPVYASGRNFDSGTRLSCLAETGVGVFGTVQHVCPTILGAATYPIAFPNGGTASGNASSDSSQFVSKMDLWGAESIYPSPYTKSYTLGNSGFNGGGGLAGALATPGWTTAGPTTTDGGLTYPGAPLFDSNNLGTATGGWVIGYLGRSDAAAACKANIGANTAHRITYNGFADWKGASSVVGAVGEADMNADGTPAGGNYDTSIQEGLYQNWETELLYKYTGASVAVKSAADKLATQIYATDASAAGISFTTMNVSKAKEGGVISHN
jgi:hypothetical protein